MDPKKKGYGNTGEMFEETIGDLYGTPEPDDEKEDDEGEKDEEE